MDLTESASPAGVARNASRSEYVQLRGQRYHLRVWGEPRSEQAPLVLVHGWMDVGASWQFVVDALAAHEGRPRHVIAPDWRGFGLTTGPRVDAYWFADYLGDLDALLDHCSPDRPVDLAGHSLGGNVVMSYAGVRTSRVRRLMNLEGFGLPATRPEDAPKRLAQWLDQLREPAVLRPYASLQAIADRLMKSNPLLPADKAAWLAPHWSERRDDGLYHLLGDPAHKRVNPVQYQRDEAVATWACITAPLLWIEGDRTDIGKWWGDRYSRSDFEARLAVVPQVERLTVGPAGHMVHHDQPEAVAARIAEFLG